MAHFNPRDPRLSPNGMLAVIWVETAIATLFVASRFFLRIFEKKSALKGQTIWGGFMTLLKSITVDDGFVYFAMLCMLISSTLYTNVIEAIYLLPEIEAGIIKPYPRLLGYEHCYLVHQFIIIILFWVTIWSVKGSFLAFYRTIFSGHFIGWQTSAWWGVVALSALTWTANFILQFFACVPFESYFILGACNNARDIHVSNDSLYFATASDIFTDLLIMALPLSVLGQLQLNGRTKVALAGMFLAGFIIILFAVLRLVYTLPSHHHVNPKWLAVWSTTESCIAVAVSCAPPFRKYFVARSYSAASSSQGAGQPAESVKVETK